MTATFLAGKFQLIPRLAGWIHLFCHIPSFYYSSCHGHLPPSPPFWSFWEFCWPWLRVLSFIVKGLLLRLIFLLGVQSHSAGESVISPQTFFVDLHTPIVRVFLDSPRLSPCSKLLNIFYHEIENPKKIAQPHPPLVGGQNSFPSRIGSHAAPCIVATSDRNNYDFDKESRLKERLRSMIVRMALWNQVRFSPTQKQRKVVPGLQQNNRRGRRLEHCQATRL